MEVMIPIFLFICVTAVLILRPITKKLGLLIEAFARSKMGSPTDNSGEVAALRPLMEQMSKRLDLFDERLDFTERLVSSAQRQALSATPRHEQGIRLDPLGQARPDAFAREREPDYLSR